MDITRAARIDRWSLTGHKLEALVRVWNELRADSVNV